MVFSRRGSGFIAVKGNDVESGKMMSVGDERMLVRLRTKNFKQHNPPCRHPSPFTVSLFTDLLIRGEGICYTPQRKGMKTNVYAVCSAQLERYAFNVYL